MPPKSGTRLGAYEILGPLGAGAMGEVYRARSTRQERGFAIKMRPASRGDATVLLISRRSAPRRAPV